MRFYTLGGGGNNGDPWSGLRFWLTVFLVVWGLSYLGLGWIVDSFFILMTLAIVTPIVTVFALQWWVKRSVVTSECPVCAHTSIAARNSQFNCPSCGELLQVDKQKFVRFTPPGTIDVEVQTVD
jgi:predicted RNA-binding Zn-ribbon protein involved in translation (DUF1610 family)